MGFIYQRKAAYHETDRMGIIHHANYIHWLEEARVEYLASIGMNWDAMEGMGILSPVISVQVDYKQPVTFNQTVEIEVSVLAYNGNRATFGYEIRNAAGQLCCRAQTQHCFVNAAFTLLSLKRSFPELHEKFNALMPPDEQK